MGHGSDAEKKGEIIMTRWQTVGISLLALALLSGCWDQKHLKKQRLVYASSFDLQEEQRVLTTSALRIVTLGGRATGRPEGKNMIVQAVGNTVRDSRLQMDLQISGQYSPNKTRVLLLGEDLAKQDVYPVFDVLYRDPASSLGAKVAVVRGRGEEVIKLDVIGETLVGEYLFELLESSEKSMLVPFETVQTICPILFDPGEDFVLPYIEVQDKHAKLLGTALFKDRKYTGVHLTPLETTLMLLMKGGRKAEASLMVEVNPEERQRSMRYINVTVQSMKRHRSLTIGSDGNPQLRIALKLNLVVLEYSHDHLTETKDYHEVNKMLKEEIERKARKVIDKIQRAGSDQFGIGRSLMAYHPKVWKELDWKEVYPRMEITPNIEVQIVGTGIIR